MQGICQSSTLAVCVVLAAVVVAVSCTHLKAVKKAQMFWNFLWRRLELTTCCCGNCCCCSCCCYCCLCAVRVACLPASCLLEKSIRTNNSNISNCCSSNNKANDCAWLLLLLQLLNLQPATCNPQRAASGCEILPSHHQHFDELRLQRCEKVSILAHSCHMQQETVRRGVACRTAICQTPISSSKSRRRSPTTCPAPWPAALACHICTSIKWNQIG